MGNNNTQAWRPSDRLCPKLVGRLMTKGAAQWRANGKKELDQSGSVSFCSKARNFGSLWPESDGSILGLLCGSRFYEFPLSPHRVSWDLSAR